MPDSVNVYPPTSDNWTRGRQSIYSIHCRSPAQSESIARLSTKPRLFGVIRRLSTRPGRPSCWYSACSTVGIRTGNVRLHSALLPPQNHLKVPFHSGVESTCGRDRDARGKHLCRLPQSRIATNLTGLWGLWMHLEATACAFAKNFFCFALRSCAINDETPNEYCKNSGLTTLLTCCYNTRSIISISLRLS